MSTTSLNARARIPVAAPVLAGREREYVMECLDSTWISSSGRFITEFERAFAQFCGVEHAIAVNNGTTALHLALVALGVGPGDEVIVPTLTYIATANAVRYCGATPVFIDCEPRTLNLDPRHLAATWTRRTKGIIPVHLYGHPCEMGAIRDFARSRELFVLEDAAEAVGARYKDKLVGGLGECATFSFFGNKIITTGEGGMVTTNDPALAKRLRLYRGQGMDPDRRYWFPVVGYNYRMTNVAAAIGLAQLECIDEFLLKRRAIARWYDEALASASNYILLPVEEDWAHHSFWMYTITMREGTAQCRDELMAYLDKEGIETRPVFYPMHVMPPYQQHSPQFPIAEHCSSLGINLPTHSGLTKDDVDYIASAIIRYFRQP